MTASTESTKASALPVHACGALVTPQGFEKAVEQISTLDKKTKLKREREEQEDWLSVWCSGISARESSAELLAGA